MAARSKMSVYGRSPSGTAGPHPTGGMDVGLLSVSGVVQVQVSEKGRSLVQRSPTECGVSECGLDTSTTRKPRPTRAAEQLKKSLFSNTTKTINITRHPCLVHCSLLHI